jgi:acyl-CoA hydrolase
MHREKKCCKESRVIKTSHVLPPDTNVHNTLFGGKLMAYIDDCASLSATRHARNPVVTASTDSVDFLSPIGMEDSVCLESFVTWTGRTSMEVFVKVIAEHLLTGERRIAATSFLTFVALDQQKVPIEVPEVVPETEEERKLHETAIKRTARRRQRRDESQQLADFITTNKPW